MPINIIPIVNILGVKNILYSSCFQIFNSFNFDNFVQKKHNITTKIVIITQAKEEIVNTNDTIGKN